VSFCVHFVYRERHTHTHPHAERERERELPSSRVSAVASMFAPLLLLFYSTAAVTVASKHAHYCHHHP